MANAGTIAEWNDKPLKKKNVGFAKLTIKNWGGIYTDAKDYKKQSIKILNTTRLNFSGKKTRYYRRMSSHWWVKH